MRSRSGSRSGLLYMRLPPDPRAREAPPLGWWALVQLAAHVATETLGWHPSCVMKDTELEKL